MMARVRGAWLLPLVSCIALAGCSRQETVTESFQAFGTQIEISIHGADRELSREAIMSARQDFNYMDAAWHAWRPGGLSRVNSLIPTGATFTGPPAPRPLRAY